MVARSTCSATCLSWDGAQVRDGGGVSSPLVVEPATVRAEGWPGVLENLRTFLQWPVVTEHVSSCIKSCAAVFSRLMRGVESNSDVSPLETEYSALQISLKLKVESAATCAFEKLKSVL